MLAEWTAECALEDPVLVVPWRDPEGTAQFVDLRAEPYDAYLIPEAERHPALLQGLRALNATRSPVFTAKCDAWALEPEELDDLRMELALDAASAASGFGSYVDVLWKDRAVFASRFRHEQMLDRLTRLAAELSAQQAALACVLRPAVLDFAEAREGFAVSVYVKAVGADGTHAEEEWGRALGEVVRIFRARELGTR